LKRYAALHIIVLILAVTTMLVLLPGLCRAWLVDGFETRFSPPPGTDPPSVLHGNRQTVTGNGVTSASSPLFAHSESKPGDVNRPDWREPVTGMTFVWIPKGCFMMGSNDGNSDEKPVHKVCLDGFWMEKYEVTNGQYRKFKASHESKSHNGDSLNGDRQPAVYVSWDDAKGFVKWLNKKTERTFALPSEAQWEYACRAGSTGKRFWGDSPDHACKYANVADQTAKRKWSSWTVHNCDDGFSATAPVGSFQANDFGLYDMLGNVWEWCEDIYSSVAYQEHSSNNPIYTQSGSSRVSRGGGCDLLPANLSCAKRGGFTQGGGSYDLGFRLLRTN